MYSACIDGRTSKICRELDGKTFKVKDDKPGKNLPPMHTFCRSTTLAVLPSEEELDKAFEGFKADNIPEGMDFDEWLDGLEPTEDGKLVFRDKRVDKSAESGIIKEKSKKQITDIAEKTINKVPKVNIPGYTDEECDFIYEQHKALLECARDNNDCNETAFVFSGGLSLENRKTFFGSDDVIDFGQELYGNSIVMMHNHPRNSSYSFADIVEFISNDSIKTMTIVKNNGGVEVLTKTGSFNKRDLMKELNTKEKRILRNDNSSKQKDDQYRKLVDKFIIGYEQEGVLKWIR